MYQLSLTNLFSKGDRMDTALKKYLIERGIKQSWVAKQLGIQTEVFNRIVNGHNIPTLGFAYRIAKVLQTNVETLWPPEELFSREGK